MAVSATAKIMALAEKYSTPKESKEKVENPHRVTLGRLFMQPTGGKDGKALNFSYPYFGIVDATGKGVAGFSCSNMAMLQMVEQGLLSDKCLELFEKYAEQHKRQVILK